MYGREREPELDFTDVWENTYMNYICPEYFYHFFFLWCNIFSWNWGSYILNFSGQLITLMRKDP